MSPFSVFCSSCFSLVFALVFVVDLARSGALRALRRVFWGEAEGKANDGVALPLIMEAQQRNFGTKAPIRCPSPLLHLASWASWRVFCGPFSGSAAWAYKPARLSAPQRAACRQGWSGGGTHLRFSAGAADLTLPSFAGLGSEAFAGAASPCDVAKPARLST
jgi:hypothetical protein